MSYTKVLLIKDVKRRICKESIPRIQKCIEDLEEEELWWRPNESSNSVANLILHLNGNVRQWLFSGLLGEKDERKRAHEFVAFREKNSMELSAILIKLTSELIQKLPLFNDVDLKEEMTIQGIKENGVSILMHVVEHFSYHTGPNCSAHKVDEKTKISVFYGKQSFK